MIYSATDFQKHIIKVNTSYLLAYVIYRLDATIYTKGMYNYTIINIKRKKITNLKVQNLCKYSLQPLIVIIIINYNAYQITRQDNN